MQLYTIISIAVVFLTTAALFLIFQRKNLKDYRYHVGLAGSFILAVSASLFFPKLMSVLTVNWALQIVLSFLIALLLYIILLFLVMMIISAAIPQQSLDKLKEEWEQKKSDWKNARESKRKERKAADNIRQEGSPAGTAGAEMQTRRSFSFLARLSPDGKKKKAEAVQPEVCATNLIPEPMTTPVSSDGKPVPESSENNSVESQQIHTTVMELEQINTIPVQTAQINTESVEQEQINTSTIEAERRYMPENASEEILALEPSEMEPMKPEQIDNTFLMTEQEIPSDNSTVGSITEEGNKEQEKAEENMPADDTAFELSMGNDLLDKAVLSMANSLEKSENTEKNVDTSDIIDKMGLGGIADENAEVRGLDGLSLEETIEKAFQLKLEGRMMEAAALYMNALDKKPDTETAFWVVLDICVIYKSTGHADLAEDILLTYIDEFEDLMSEEVKDQILQSLYEN